MPLSSGSKRKLLDPDDEGTKILRKVAKSLLVDTTSHPKIPL